jgi:hypothetical protein
MGELNEPKQVDLAGEIKASFEKLVEDGCNPTAAAAKAIGMVAEAQKKGPTLEPGPLDRLGRQCLFRLLPKQLALG